MQVCVYLFYPMKGFEFKVVLNLFPRVETLVCYDYIINQEYATFKTRFTLIYDDYLSIWSKIHVTHM